MIFMSITYLSLFACGTKQTTTNPMVVPKSEEEAVVETTGPTKTKGSCPLTSWHRSICKTNIVIFKSHYSFELENS